MWWLTLKKWFKISAAWCRQHWRWLILGGFALIMYSLGRKHSKGQLLQAKLALKSYEAEKAAIKRAHDKEVEGIKRAQSIYKKAMAHISQKYSAETNSLKFEEENRLRDMVKKAKNDPDEIDRILEEEMGIKNYES